MAAEQCYLCDAKDDVYRCGQWVDGAHQLTAHHLRKRQRNWLAQHHRFGLDSPNAWRRSTARTK